MGESHDSNFIISENRIDIIIGIEYVKAYDRQYKTDFFKRLYISNKRSFNRLREKRLESLGKIQSKKEEDLHFLKVLIG